ncbi:uncharacterized [Tachysurus ichikawai]
MIASDDEEVKVLLILYKDNKKDILLVADPLPGYLEMILGLFEGSEAVISECIRGSKEKPSAILPLSLARHARLGGCRAAPVFYPLGICFRGSSKAPSLADVKAISHNPPPQGRIAVIS